MNSWIQNVTKELAENLINHFEFDGDLLSVEEFKLAYGLYYYCFVQTALGKYILLVGDYLTDEHAHYIVKDQGFKPVSPTTVRGQKSYVLAFINPDSPINQAVLIRIKK